MKIINQFNIYKVYKHIEEVISRAKEVSRYSIPGRYQPSRFFVSSSQQVERGNAEVVEAQFLSLSFVQIKSAGKIETDDFKQVNLPDLPPSFPLLHFSSRSDRVRKVCLLD